MRGDIAGDARIGILAPGPADSLGFFENDKVMDAALFELDTHADARHSRAEDCDANALIHLDHQLIEN